MTLENAILGHRFAVVLYGDDVKEGSTFIAVHFHDGKEVTHDKVDDETLEMFISMSQSEANFLIDEYNKRKQAQKREGTK